MRLLVFVRVSGLPTTKGIMAAGFDGCYACGAQNIVVDGQQRKQGVAVLGEHNVRIHGPKFSRSTKPNGNVTTHIPQTDQQTETEAGNVATPAVTLETITRAVRPGEEDRGTHRGSGMPDQAGLLSLDWRMRHERQVIVAVVMTVCLIGKDGRLLIGEAYRDVFESSSGATFGIWCATRK